MVNRPLVSIGALNYNNERFVVATLESIRAQTYDNIELIVIDDCSTDNSLQLIRDWLATYDKPYKLVTHEKNKGVSEAYNSVISYSTGEYVSFIATDDLLMPYKVEKQVQLFSSLSDDYGVVFGDLVEIDENDQQINPPNFQRRLDKDPGWRIPQGYIYKDILKEFTFYVQSALIKRKFLSESNFIFRKHYISEDWYFFLFLASKCKFYGTNDVFVKYRIHSQSITQKLWTDEKYFIWQMGHIHMFLDVVKFRENDKDDKRIIGSKLSHYLLSYSYHKSSDYKKAIQTWVKVLPFVSLPGSLKAFLYINKFKIALSFRNRFKKAKF